MSSLKLIAIVGSNGAHDCGLVRAIVADLPDGFPVRVNSRKANDEKRC